MNFKKKKQNGFSLLELAVVLSVIAVIIGAVSSGRHIYRQAVSQRIQNDFIDAWRIAFNTYMARRGRVPPGDNASNPTYLINRALNLPICNNGGGAGAAPLSNIMLGSGIDLPSGRTQDQPDRYAYQDMDGVPHELQICFMTVPWAISGLTVRTYVQANRHVMSIQGLTPELAMQLDNFNDGRLDARFGLFRHWNLAGNTGPNSIQWDAVPPAGLTAFLLMSN